MFRTERFKASMICPNRNGLVVLIETCPKLDLVPGSEIIEKQHPRRGFAGAVCRASYDVYKKVLWVFLRSIPIHNPTQALIKALYRDPLSLKAKPQIHSSIFGRSASDFIGCCPSIGLGIWSLGIPIAQSKYYL